MFWLHYVDDIVSCIPNKELEESLDFINSTNSNLLFTSEEENSSVIHFLDLEIMKLHARLKFIVYIILSDQNR